VGPPQYWGVAPPTHTDRRVVAARSGLSIDHAEFPHPLIHRPERVLKRLVPMQPEIAQRRGPRLTAKAVELLAVYAKCVATAALPAEHGMKDVIKVGQILDQAEHTAVGDAVLDEP
jgi:hypothetical protein